MINKIDEIVSFAAKYFSVKVTDLYSNVRKSECITAKHLAWYILHYEYGVNTSLLAKEFYRTRRDVFLGISKIKNGIQKQKFYKDLYERFIEEYKNGSK